jgi:hypothetical protein
MLNCSVASLGAGSRPCSIFSGVVGAIIPAVADRQRTEPAPL